ncbi:hypothetical protein [uncultured Clostridium sp.]|uniref:hypothetical protein n=1 Tax=uncultured Clostridium sp. TaxID=59620 RepID=UPI0025E4D96B|nr:hypothetical protein [uncultured Clostridium sp.]
MIQYSDLREDEKKLIDTFRKLNENGKKRALGYVEDVTGVKRFREEYHILDKTGLKYKS